jgi:hypothetical protein
MDFKLRQRGTRAQLAVCLLKKMGESGSHVVSNPERSEGTLVRKSGSSLAQIHLYNRGPSARRWGWKIW